MRDDLGNLPSSPFRLTRFDGGEARHAPPDAISFARCPFFDTGARRARSFRAAMPASLREPRPVQMAVAVEVTAQRESRRKRDNQREQNC